MNANTSLGDTSTRATTDRSPTRRVVDAPTRMFHWLFALSFLGAYLTADGERWRLLHITLGYTLAGLLAFRVLYGLWGPPQARLSMLLRKLKASPQWLESAWASALAGTWTSVNWRQGQNLLMALAVVLLLVLVVPLTLSGYATFHDWGDLLGGDWVEDLHGFIGEAFLLVVLAHLALIAGLSLLRHKNMVQPMLTGRIHGSGPDLARSDHFWLALLLLAAVLAYGTWEWQHSPKGLITPEAIGGAWSGGNHDDDD